MDVTKIMNYKQKLQMAHVDEKEIHIKQLFQQKVVNEPQLYCICFNLDIWKVNMSLS